MGSICASLGICESDETKVSDETKTDDQDDDVYVSSFEVLLTLGCTPKTARSKRGILGLSARDIEVGSLSHQVFAPLGNLDRRRREGIIVDYRRSVSNSGTFRFKSAGILSNLKYENLVSKYIGTFIRAIFRCYN